MGRIFLLAGYGTANSKRLEPIELAAGQDILTVRDLTAAELRSRGFEVLSLPDGLSGDTAVHWINQRDRAGDIALKIYASTHANPAFRGTCVYYIAHNSERKQHADLILLALTRRIPQLVIRGSLPDTTSDLGYLDFCRQAIPASLYLQIGFLSNPDDRSLIHTRQQEIALGLADGLTAWNQMIAEGPFAQPPLAALGEAPALSASERPSPININVNERLYGELGIMVNGNAYIPVDLVDRLGISPDELADRRRLTHGHVVYLKAIDLRELDISVHWDSSTRTLNLRSILQICRPLYKITGTGYTSEVQMLMFLKAHNEVGLSQFPDIARLYRDEGTHEGINYDVAFAQMCVETNFLRFGGSSKPTQNNFGGLGTTSGSPEGASFPNARIGVRAHIQHLKAYANTEPLREEVVDPRFNLVIRGIAPSVDLLTGRWSSTPNYGDRILAIVRQLYETAGLL